MGFIGQDDRLSLKGLLLRSIFHPAGITIIELLMSGTLDELSAQELAEVCSWFVYDNDRRLNNKHVLGNRLLRVRRELWHIVQHVRGIEERAGIALSPVIVPEFHGLALSWSRNMSLGGLLRRIDLAEGDILMLLNQTIDLLQQVQTAVGQVLDSPGIWSSIAIDADGESPSERRARGQANLLQKQRERLEHIRPLLSQGAASLLHGIIVQSRTIPSMVAQVGDEALPLDAEEDRDAQNLSDPQTFVGEI